MDFYAALAEIGGRRGAVPSLRPPPSVSRARPTHRRVARRAMSRGYCDADPHRPETRDDGVRQGRVPRRLPEADALFERTRRSRAACPKAATALRRPDVLFGCASGSRYFQTPQQGGGDRAARDRPAGGPERDLPAASLGGGPRPPRRVCCSLCRGVGVRVNPRDRCVDPVDASCRRRSQGGPSAAHGLGIRAPSSSALAGEVLPPRAPVARPRGAWTPTATVPETARSPRRGGRAPGRDWVLYH